jgi:hypothetical protein
MYFKGEKKEFDDIVFEVIFDQECNKNIDKKTVNARLLISYDSQTVE